MTKDELELEKLRLEVEQAQLEVQRKRIEVRNAGRSYFKQPASWITLITAAVGLVTTSSQWYAAVKEKAQVAEAASEVTQNLEAANEKIEGARAEALRNEERFAMVEQRLAETGRLLDQPGRTAPPEAARLRESLAAAREASVEARAGFSNRLTTLQPVRVDPEALRVIQQARPRK